MTRARILATGDVTVDWSFVELSGSTGDPLSMAWAWNEGIDVRAVRSVGGSARVGDMLAAMAARGGGEVEVIGPELPPEALSSPLDTRVTRTFSSVGRFPRSTADRTAVLRIQRFWGRHPSESFSSFTPPLEGSVDVVAINDLALDYRQRPDEWRAWEEAKPRAVIVSTMGPFEDNPLLDHLLDQWADRLTVVIQANDLRMAGAAVGLPLSWERTAEEVDAAVRAGPMGRAARVVVQLELSGALVLDRGGGTTLVFDPSVPEGAWMRQRAGTMPGYPLCYVTALALPSAKDEEFNAVEAVRRGVQATRVLLSEGLGEVTETDLALAFPMDAVAKALTEDPADIHATLHPRPDGSTSIIASAIDESALADAAMKLALGGPASLPAGVPVERVGNWSSVDRREIETLRGVGNVIDEYVSLYRAGGVVPRPLSVAVFGPPGAGKSFAVKETIGQKVAGGVKTLEFNLSQFAGDHELPPAFHQVRDAVLEQHLPLVFWDEFDTPLDGSELGWLRHFLAPMQDGKFRENGAFHPLGPAIFVFAGGTASSFAEFSSLRDERAEKVAKKPDFISRLRGFVDILGPNKSHADDTAVVLRRALLLRSLLLRKEPQLIARGGGQTLRIDPRVLRAFLLVDRYRHGARSMEAIIDMSQLAGSLCFERSSLPAPHLLEIHVDAQEFLGLTEG